ncbi:fibroblast growth factor receptor substrate 2 [Trichonephila clavipes]|nr:fibroblast growth factor receptor substrate 2 [Trichonephila clavipes]
MSWRSLPHFGATSSLNRLVPKRSTSHFYANADACKEKHSGPKGKSIVESDPKSSDIKDLSEKHDSDESLAVLSSLSNSSKGSDPNMYAKIYFDQPEALSHSANQTSFEENGTKQMFGANVATAGTQT